MGTLVNHTVSNLQGGVTQQFDELASEVQVRELLNCLPSLSRGVLRRNPVENSLTLNDSFLSRDYFIYAYDKGNTLEQYLMFIGNGEWKVFNATTKTLISEGTNPYLNIPIGISAKEAFSVITVGDFTFVANKYVKTAMVGSVDGVADSHKKTGIYWIKSTSSNTVASTSEPKTIGSTTYFNAVQGNIIEGYSYTLNGQLSTGVKDTRYGATLDRLTGDKIVSHLATLLGAGYVPYASTLYKLNMLPTDGWNWGDSLGNNASFGFKGVVQRADQLPINLPSALIDTVVNVTQNTNETLDDYWLNYTGSTWVETRKPGMYNRISSSTMPHVIVRLAGGSFELSQYTETALTALGVINEDNPYGWKSRQVGDEKTAPKPSFIGNYITNVFFHNNRLGFTSGDNITLSEDGNYGNFFNTTVRYIPPTDAIDISIATTDINNINYVVATNTALLLFSNRAQFMLTSGSEPLTPVTAQIQVLSKYNTSNSVAPIAFGNAVIFAGETGGYTQLFYYVPSKDSTALNVSTHIPTYIPKNIKLIAGNNILGHMFMWSPDTPKTIYVYSQNITDTSKSALSSFHKWTFSKDVLGFNILNNELVITFQETSSNACVVGTLSVELPGDFSLTSYADFGDTSYESSIEFSKWFIKDSSQNGSKAGRLQIRTLEYTIDKRSFYSTFIVTDDGTVSSETGLWSDILLWNDLNIWSDGVLFYTLRIDNKDKVQILGNSKDTLIVFKSDSNNPYKGFELATFNLEGYYHSRSQRI